MQILEDSGKYWLYQYCRYWKIRYEVAECTCILFFLSCLCVCYERTDSVYGDREKGEEGETKEGRVKGESRWEKGEEGRQNPVQLGGIDATGAGIMVFGIVDTSTTPGTGYLRIVIRRDAATLLPIIQNVTRPGGIIHSDQWRAYHGIQQQLGLQHRTVNHSLNLSTQLPAYTPNTSSRTGTNAKDDLKPCTERQSASCPVIWMSSCGETDSTGHTKTASTTSKDTTPNFIQCSDQSTFSITVPFQGHQYY